MAQRATWREILTVGVVAALVVVVSDIALQRVAPPVLQREVDDAVAAFRRVDPTILVVGSSHARTFDVVDEELRRRTRDRQRILSVPVEWGKLTTYRFVLRERLNELVARDRARPRPPSLRRLILVTEWWDTVPPDTGERATNLPARAWAFPHFLADVADRGFDPFNRNFLNARWRRLFRRSSLVQNHGHDRIIPGLRALLRPPGPEERERRFAERVVDWNRMLEEGNETMLDPEQLQAFEDIVSWAEGWGLEVTVLLYPRMPVTLTEKAKRTTIARYTAAITERIRARGVRMIDYTTRSPLTDDHFAMDFDHVTREGNELFARWALDGELGFLTRPVGKEGGR